MSTGFARPRTRPPRDPGMTMIELVVVLVIMGILAAVVVGRFMTFDEGKLYAQNAVMATHIRYAQTRAMKYAAFWGAASSGTQFWVFNGTDSSNSANWVNLPGASSTPIALADNDIGMTSFTLLFDQYGRPYSAPGTLLTAPLLITITYPNPNPTRQVILTVTPETGFLQ